MKRIGTIIIIALILIFSYLIYDFVSFRERYAVSDAAFVRSDSLTNLSFKVGGKIAQLFVKEGDSLKQGQIIAKIDPKDFLLSKQKLQNQLQAIKERIEAAKIGLQKTNQDVKLLIKESHLKKERALLQKKAVADEIGVIEAKLQKLLKDLKRYEKLWRQHLIARGDLEKIQTQSKIVQKKLAVLKQKLSIADKVVEQAELGISLANTKQLEIKRLQKEIKGMRQQEEALQKSIAQIDNKITYCTLKAPYDSVVAKRFVNVDQVVEKGYPIVAIVDPKKLHIEVLLSEKKLRGVKPGNDVKITIDAFKDRKYKGKVQAILPASAATFALVPRDIASGEFTKLDQRFVVRISIENPTPDLRVGMGASVAIKRD